MYRTLYEQYSTKINAKFKRDDKTWDELTGPLSSTFVFKDPHVIKDENNKIIGYFCITPGKKDVIREFIPSCDERSVIKALAIVSNYLGLENEHRLEIFAPSRGPIWNVAKESIGADFQCFLRPRSSNMIKWISKKENSKVNDMFLLQGDLL